MKVSLFYRFKKGICEGLPNLLIQERHLLRYPYLFSLMISKALPLVIATLSLDE